MLLRAAFLFTLILPTGVFAAADNCPLPQFEWARAAKDKIQGVVGGANKCSSLTTKDIKAFECRTNVKNVGRALTMSDDLNAIAAGMFFQGLASNSHKQANCRLSALGKYFGDANAKTQMHVKAEQAFTKVHHQLKTLVEKRNELQANLNRMNIDAAADRAMSRMTYNGRKQHEKSIAQLSDKITRTLTIIPLGYDPDVGRALIQMSLGSKFDPALFEDGVKNAVTKYEETAKYYEQKFTQTSKGRGTYCLGLDYRNLAGKSGQIDQWLQTLPNSTAADRALKQKLSCRLDAHYETGSARLSNGVMIAGFATYLLPPAWIPRAGGAVIGAAEMVARGSAAVVAVLSMDAMRSKCFPPSGIISGEGMCDADKEFAHVLQEPEYSACAGLPLMGASLVGEARGVTMAVKAARAQRVKAVSAVKLPPSPKSAAEVGEALGKSDKFQFFRKGDGKLKITKDTFSPDNSYTVLVRDGKVIIGEDFVGGMGKTAGSHVAMRESAFAIPRSDLTPAPGGAIRVHKDGSIDVSAYYSKGRDPAGMKAALDEMVSALRSAMPGVQIRATTDRLSTLPNK